MCPRSYLRVPTFRSCASRIPYAPFVDAPRVRPVAICVVHYVCIALLMPSIVVGCGPDHKDETTNGVDLADRESARFVGGASSRERVAPRSEQPSSIRTGSSTSSANAGDSSDNIPSLEPPAAFAETHATFDRYWYQGKAELNRYRLVQSRYGDRHPGEAVLVFVTEDFLTERQVKREQPSEAPWASALKLIAYRRFYTGIYPYTLNVATYLPARQPGAAWKLTASIQEWCGSTFTQLNRRDGRLAAVLHSYFEQEADQAVELPDVMLEDAVWGRIRRGPSALPTGDLQLLPAAHALRFSHRPLRAERATARLEDAERFGATRRYVVEYKDWPRVLRIYFRSEFPFEILGWEEEGDGPATVAERTHAGMDDYWSHHNAEHQRYQQALGLAL